MKKIPKKVYSLIYLILFVILIVFSYNTSKKKPDSVLELFTNFKWLNNWPKWLDTPLRDYVNSGWKVLIVEQND